mmetsp:Transcript_29662/g.89250  ORF Transcript_29662/g.89250 Transcript_29662/m.89250 type:complete len:208 (+) Transcript_29662:222-845(+)
MALPERRHSEPMTLSAWPTRAPSGPPCIDTKTAEFATENATDAPSAAAAQPPVAPTAMRQDDPQQPQLMARRTTSRVFREAEDARSANVTPKRRPQAPASATGGPAVMWPMALRQPPPKSAHRRTALAKYVLSPRAAAGFRAVRIAWPVKRQHGPRNLKSAGSEGGPSYDSSSAASRPRMHGTASEPTVATTGSKTVASDMFVVRTL